MNRGFLKTSDTSVQYYYFKIERIFFKFEKKVRAKTIASLH